MKRAAWVLAAALFVPALAFAHQKSVSYSTWTLLGDGALVQAKVRWLELTSLPMAGGTDAPLDRAEVLDYLQSKLTLESEDQPCAPAAQAGNWLPADRGWARVEWRVLCEETPVRLRSELFRTLPNHVHLATVIGPDAVMTDALSTSVFVMGVELGMKLLAGLPDYEGIVIDDQGRIYYSDGLMRPEAGE